MDLSVKHAMALSCSDGTIRYIKRLTSHGYYEIRPDCCSYSPGVILRTGGPSAT